MNDQLTDIKKLSEIILAESEKMPKEQCLLVGISGIDSSGKGFITAKLVKEIRNRGVNAVAVNIDGWLNLPHIRFNPKNPAENFYENGLRFEEMFKRLVLPLKANRTINLTADFAEETAEEFRKHIYDFDDVEIILLEGIFLFKNAFRGYFDLKIWVECSFETALERAIHRSQEGLPPEETVKAYQTIYFPAQDIHFAEDNPQSHADLIYNNNRTEMDNGK